MKRKSKNRAYDFTISVVVLAAGAIFATCGGGADGSGGQSCSDAAVANDIPFDYAIDTATDPEHILIHTPGGDLRTSIGPWGTHTQPHTGHDGGDGKANWAGLFAVSFDELTELSGDSDGVCERGETCGLTGSQIEERTPEYIAPVDDFLIWSVRVEFKRSSYYGSDLQWRVEGVSCNFNYAFGHAGKVSKDLRDKMVAAGYTDPWTVTGVTDNLITGDGIMLSKGESICKPQVFALEVPGHTGYYRGGGNFPQTPWAQIEFFTRWKNQMEPFYAWLPGSVQSQLEAILFADALNPVSFRYDTGFVSDWLWKSEMALWTVDYLDLEDFSTIFSHLGRWMETDPGGCTAGSSLCDILFVIFPIMKSSPFYEPTLYDSPSVSYLVHRHDRSRSYYQWGEVIDPAAPDAVSGSMTIKWRQDGFTPVTFYQAISYSLNTSAKLLKIRWGGEVPLRSSVIIPEVPGDTDACDGVNVTCHNNDAE